MSKNSNIQKKNPKFELQDQQYEFPYHYITSFDENGIGIKYRYLNRGYEYLCYVRHVLELIKRNAPDSFLEVGCGDGRVIGYVQNVNKKVGIDLSSRAISFAKAFHPDIEFYVRDASNIDGQFDLVAAVEVLEHIPDNKVTSFLKTLANKTKKGGKVIITVPTKVKPLISKHYRHYDKEIFQQQLEKSGANLVIEHIEYIFSDSKLLQLYRRFTKNKFWLFHSSFLDKLMWNYVWKNLRFAAESEGLHLVVTLKKEANNEDKINN